MNLRKRKHDDHNALFNAIEYNRIKELKELLKYHDANKDDGGKFPIEYACDMKNFECAKILIEHGVNINSRINGITLLIRACSSGDEELVKFLLKENAGTNYPDKNFNYPIHYACKVDSVSESLNNGRRPDARVAITKLLIEYGAFVNFKDLSGMTPLGIACVYNNLELVELLLNNNAAVNLTSDDRFPINIATLKGSFKIVKKLLYYGASFDQYDKLNPPPIHIAAREGNLNLVKLFISYGDSIENFGEDESNAFESAVDGCHLNVIDFFLEKYKNNIKLFKRTRFIIHQFLCGESSDKEIFNRLLTLYDTYCIGDEDGYTPLILAIMHKKYKFAEFFISKDAGINNRTKDGESPLFYASKQDAIHIADLLIKNGAKVNSKTKLKRETPLHLATHLRLEDMIYLLLENGANINIADSDGLTPLTNAIRVGLEEKILEKMMDFNPIKKSDPVTNLYVNSIKKNNYGIF